MKENHIRLSSEESKLFLKQDGFRLSRRHEQTTRKGLWAIEEYMMNNDSNAMVKLEEILRKTSLIKKHD